MSLITYNGQYATYNGKYLVFNNSSLIAAMSADPTSWTFDPAGDVYNFSVTSNVAWDVSTNPDWISISNKSGQTGNGSFDATASQNNNSYRYGYIVLKSTDTPDLYPQGVIISVDQDIYVTDSISLDNYNLYWNYDGTNCYGYRITVTSSGSWTASWTNGTYFSATTYSGNDGDYTDVYCNGTNTDYNHYTDSLDFYCGTAQTSCNCDQGYISSPNC